MITDIRILFIVINSISVQVLELIKSSIIFHGILSLSDLPVYFRRKVKHIKKEDNTNNSASTGKTKSNWFFKKVKKFFRYLFIIIRHLYRFIKNIVLTTTLICRNNIFLIKNCLNFINKNIVDGIEEFAIVGINDAAKIIILLMKKKGVKIKGVYDNVSGLRFFGYYVKDYSELRCYSGVILVTSSINIYEKVEKLRKIGISPKNIRILNNE